MITEKKNKRVREKDRFTKVRSNNEIILRFRWDERKQPIIYTAHVAIISAQTGTNRMKATAFCAHAP